MQYARGARGARYATMRRRAAPPFMPSMRAAPQMPRYAMASNRYVFATRCCRVAATDSMSAAALTPDISVFARDVCLMNICRLPLLMRTAHDMSRAAGSARKAMVSVRAVPQCRYSDAHADAQALCAMPYMLFMRCGGCSASPSRADAAASADYCSSLLMIFAILRQHSYAMSRATFAAAYYFCLMLRTDAADDAACCRLPPMPLRHRLPLLQYASHA